MPGALCVPYNDSERRLVHPDLYRALRRRLNRFVRVEGHSPGAFPLAGVRHRGQATRQLRSDPCVGLIGKERFVSPSQHQECRGAPLLPPFPPGACPGQQPSGVPQHLHKRCDTTRHKQPHQAWLRACGLVSRLHGAAAIVRLSTVDVRTIPEMPSRCGSGTPAPCISLRHRLPTVCRLRWLAC